MSLGDVKCGDSRNTLTAGLNHQQRKVRTSRYAAREEHKAGGCIPDGVSTSVDNCEGSGSRTRKMKQGQG